MTKPRIIIGETEAALAQHYTDDLESKGYNAITTSAGHELTDTIMGDKPYDYLIFDPNIFNPVLDILKSKKFQDYISESIPELKNVEDLESLLLFFKDMFKGESPSMRHIALLNTPSDLEKYKDNSGIDIYLLKGSYDHKTHNIPTIQEYIDINF